MPLLTGGPILGTIGNTNAITQIVPTLPYLEKEPVLIKDCNMFFPFNCRCLFSTTVPEP